MSSERLDLLIVGAGPAGLAAANAARVCGLRSLVLERGALAQTICDYPVKRPLHSPPQDVELAWGEAFASRPPNVSREEILAHYREFSRRRGLEIREQEGVRRIEREAGGFAVRTSRATYHATRVLVATGGFGIARRLEVPGANDEERVHYRFVEGNSCAARDVLVVGGGNSAAEAALWLHESGARVTLSLRRPSFAPRGGPVDAFTAVKPFNVAPLLELAARGEMRILFSSRVVALTPDAAIIESENRRWRIPCERVFALLGADPDVMLLRQIGAAVAADGRPVYDPQTYETTVPGLYVAGHLTRELHIPKAVVIAPKIVHRIAGRMPSARGAGLVLDAAAQATKTLRRRNPFVRRLVRDYPLLRRPVQAADAANVLRDLRLSLAWKMVSRYPRVRGWLRTLRAYAS
jgi:thioredoxin reductase (NADPH)